jgi:DHA3 family tetracycline resistance protein-like MFS transporter
MLLHKSKLSAYTVYLIFSGVTSLSGSLISTVNMVYQVETARLNPLQLVLVGTVLEFVAFVCQVPTGVLADIYSRRLAVILGTLLFGMAFVLEGSFPRFDVILVSQILFGIGATLSDGAEQAWITDEVGEMRIGHVFLRSTQVGLLAGLLGAIISVGLASIRINIPIVIGGALSIGVAGFLLLFMPENNFHPISKAERRTWRDMGNTFRSGLHVVRGRPILITILLIALFYGLYSEGFDRLWTAHFLTNFTFPTLGQLKPVVWFGIISVVGTLLTLGATEVVRLWVNIAQQRILIRALFVINFLAIVCLLVFALVGNFFLAVAAVLLFKVFRTVNDPVYTTWLTQNIEAKVRATVISMRGQVDAFGQIVGGPPVGYIGTTFSIQTALLASCALLSPVLFLYAYAARKVREKLPQPS